MYVSPSLDLIYIQWNESNTIETVTKAEFDQMVGESTIFLGKISSRDVLFLEIEN
jgi:hypothetical protein